jgi:hypothetical protein
VGSSGSGEIDANVGQHRPEGHVGLPVPGAKRHERDSGLELLESLEPFLEEKTFIKRLPHPDLGGILPGLLGGALPGLLGALGLGLLELLREVLVIRCDIERLDTGANNEDGRLAHNLPVIVADKGAVFVADCAKHGGSGLVAGGRIDIGVDLAICEGPEDLLWIMGRADRWSRVWEGEAARVDLCPSSGAVRAQGTDDCG